MSLHSRTASNNDSKHLHPTAVPTPSKRPLLIANGDRWVYLGNKEKPGLPELPDKQLPCSEGKQQPMENLLMGEGASDACLNIRGQGKEIKQEFKEAPSGKRARVKEKASVHNFP